MPFPNEDTQFEPGKSGNPSGRPKGVRNLSSILKEMLEEKIEVVEDDGSKNKQQFKDVIVKKLLKKAKDGDLRAIQEIFDRVEGKPRQEIIHEIPQGILNVDPLSDDQTNAGTS